MHLLMIAAECKGLAKVGGLADVVHDLSTALVSQGQKVHILLPGYDLIPQAPTMANLHIPFGARTWSVEIQKQTIGGSEVMLVRSPEFFSGTDGVVYVNSAASGKGPFEDDARRFAFFSTCAAYCLEDLPELSTVDIIHCHDWHSGLVPVLTRMSGRFPQSARKPILFTIHNLDYQGQRPLFDGGPSPFSSFSDWFPDDVHTILSHPDSGVLIDPKVPTCINPLRAAINLADHVSTVSPNYAQEITRPDDSDSGFLGGRGLEHDLLSKEVTGSLHGILNGIFYNEHDPGLLVPPFDRDRPAWWDGKKQHKETLRQQIQSFSGTTESCNLIALDNSQQFSEVPLAVAVTRVVQQKVRLLLEPLEDSRSLLHHLAQLNLNILVLGTGDLAAELAAIGDPLPNCCFLQRFDSTLANFIYAGGDIFLMPSDFEPCGISQMIAMRYGTVPVATAVGGLADTITNNETGITVPVGSRLQTARDYYEATKQISSICNTDIQGFHRLQESSMAQRFPWELAANKYVELYEKLQKNGVMQGPYT